MPLYFAEATVADEISSPEDARLVEVGRLILDELANGIGTFTVPDVRSGGYVLMTYCTPCAPSSGGRAMLPVGPFPPSPPFRVLGGSVGKPTAIWVWVLTGALGALMATAALATARRRRSG